MITYTYDRVAFLVVDVTKNLSLLVSGLSTLLIRAIRLIVHIHARLT